MNWRDIVVVPYLRKGGDTVQTAPAEQGGADYLVTWNVKAVASAEGGAGDSAGCVAGTRDPAGDASALWRRPPLSCVVSAIAR